jgi:RimJ/RimL family protein N-acetyltransferase
VWGTITSFLVSELVPPLSRYCFEQSGGVPRLVAFTDPDNAASQRVLTKNGFRHVGERTENGMAGSVFWLEKVVL